MKTASLGLSTADFLVGTPIGEGSFGRVLHCKHKESRLHVAMKVVEKISLRSSGSRLQAVLREQKILQQLKETDAVITLWASFHDSQCVYLAMECVCGGNLQEWIEQQHKQCKTAAARNEWLASAAHYSLQLLRALQQIHSQGIIHADICPRNILLTESGLVRIADFGSALYIASSSSQDRLAVGTAGYASPEILKGQAQLTIATDLWSLGCTLYALIDGKSPFHAETDALAVTKTIEFANEADQCVRAQILFGGNNELFPTEWRSMIETLLRPSSERQTNVDGRVSDACRTIEQWYGRLEENCAFWNDVDLSTRPSILPTKPGWLRADEDNETAMADGSLGWSAFLL
jgi:serine/threonine protein kinase